MVKINDQTPADFSNAWRGPRRDKRRTPWVIPNDSWLHKAVLHPLQGRPFYHLLAAALLPFVAILFVLMVAVVGSFA